jgi:protein-disulfide isomerase
MIKFRDGNPTMSTLSTPVGARDHSVGPAQAPITIVEYGDFQCSHSGRAYLVVKALQQRIGMRLRFAFRNFPIVELHPRSLVAAEAAEAAASQGRFWKMHDLLFENQRALGTAALDRYARALELDMGRFTDDMNEHTFRSRIQADVETGVMSGVEGTPTFFINGVRYEGAHDLVSLLAASVAVGPEAR